MRVRVCRSQSGGSGALDEPRLDAHDASGISLRCRRRRWRRAIAIAALAARSRASGLVVEMAGGCPDRAAAATLAARPRAAASRLAVLAGGRCGRSASTPERLGSYRRHWLVINLYRLVVEPRGAHDRRCPCGSAYALPACRRATCRDGFCGASRRAVGLPSTSAQPPASDHAPPDAGRGRRAPPPMVRHAQRLAALREARQTAKPFRFRRSRTVPIAQHPIPGCGVYLRTDFWAPIVSGGSYGHTCYVAKELAAVTESFVCFMAQPVPAARRIRRRAGRHAAAERRPATKTTSRRRRRTTSNLLRPAFEELRPGVHLRAALPRQLGGALLSAEFGIPYIVEYNGSEISMRRSFEGTGYVYEAEYLEAEALAFEQATLITVVSAEIRNALVGARRRSGEDPGQPQRRRSRRLRAGALRTNATRFRRELGFAPSDRVDRFHRHVRRLARHRRAERGDSADLPRTLRARSSC